MKRAGCLLLLCLLVWPASSLADTITTQGSGGYVPFPAWPPASNNGSPYWNQPSADGAGMNIGYFMTNTGAFSGSTQGPGPLSFWANAGGTADRNFYFVSNTSSSVAALLIEIAGYRNINIFGWYQVSNPSNRAVIFNGPASAGAVTTITIPVTDYGFFIQVGAGGPIYYTQSSLNPAGDTTHQHFVVFAQNPPSPTPTYWIGMEDLPLGSSTLLNREGNMGDYNDMVVRITPIPEPGTLVLLGTGLIGVAGLVRRKLPPIGTITQN